MTCQGLTPTLEGGLVTHVNIGAVKYIMNVQHLGLPYTDVFNTMQFITIVTAPRHLLTGCIKRENPPPTQGIHIQVNTNGMYYHVTTMELPKGVGFRIIFLLPFTEEPKASPAVI